MAAKTLLLVGADAPAGTREESRVVLRVDPLRPAAKGSLQKHARDDSPEHGGARWPENHGRDDSPDHRGTRSSSGWAEERQSHRRPQAAAVEDRAEMERQVRDQLYGPGFRRR